MRSFILDRTDPAVMAAAHRLAKRYAEHFTVNDVCSYGSYDDADNTVGVMFHGVRVSEPLNASDRDHAENLGEAQP